MSKEKEIRIRAANQLADELKNIAKNEGISLADFLRPRLREIVDNTPEEKKRRID